MSVFDDLVGQERVVALLRSVAISAAEVAWASDLGGDLFGVLADAPAVLPDAAFVAVPGSGNLPPGTAPNAAGAQGIWLRLTLPPGGASYKGSADIRIQGTTT